MNVIYIPPGWVPPPAYHFWLDCDPSLPGGKLLVLIRKRDHAEVQVIYDEKAEPPKNLAAIFPKSVDTQEAETPGQEKTLDVFDSGD